MADLNIFPGDLLVQGRLVPAAFTPPADSIPAASIQAAAGIEASKLQHQHQATTPLGNHATAAATLRVSVHRCKGATGTIVSFHVTASVVPTGGDSVTVRLLVNGVAVLSASVVIDSANTVYVGEAGTISSASLVAGDLVEAEITAVSGTSGKGIACHTVIREDAQ